MHPLERIGVNVHIKPWMDAEAERACRDFWGQRDYVGVRFEPPLTPEELRDFPVSGFPGRPYVYSHASPPAWRWDCTGPKHRLSDQIQDPAQYADVYYHNLSSALTLGLNSFALSSEGGALFDWTGVQAAVQEILTILGRRAVELYIYASAGFAAENVDAEGKPVMEPKTHKVLCRGYSAPNCETVTIMEEVTSPKSSDDPDNVIVFELHFWEQWKGGGEDMMEGLGTYPKRASAFFLGSFTDTEQVRGPLESGTLLPFSPAAE